MKVSQKIVSALVVCILVWTGTLAAAQNETAPSSGTPAAPVQATPREPAPEAQKPAEDAGPAPVAATTNPPAPSPKSGAKPAAGTTNAQGRYVIGPLDVVVVKVWNQPQLSGPVSVGPDGLVSLSLIGEVKADGLTTLQLRDVIKTRLNEFLNNPEVDVTIGKINSKRYYVYGGVAKGGEFQLDQKTTIMDALSLVGGFKDFAKPDKITIHRGTETFKFNYKDFIKGKNMDKNANIELQNGDRIVVPE